MNNRVIVKGLALLAAVFSGMGLASDVQLNHPEQLKTQIQESPQSLAELKAGFAKPAQRYYPETWFHLNGKNISKAGLTADLEAIKYSGMQGIQLFNKKGPAYPNVEQVSILSPEWEQMIGHVADETQRLGLNLTFQNCPGWSMAGGPWVPAEEAQRELIHHEFQIVGGKDVQQLLTISDEYRTADRNYQDVEVLAFKTPKDHQQIDLTPATISSNNKAIPWHSIFDKNQRIDYQFHPRRLQPNEPYKTYQQEGIRPVAGKATWVTLGFEKPVTLRSIELPPVRSVFMDRQYPKTNIAVQVEAFSNNQWQLITTLQVPTTHWYDLQYPATLAVPATTSQKFRLTFKKDPLFLAYVKLNGRAYLHNHEAKASKSSRNIQSDIHQKTTLATTINSDNVINISKYMNAQGELNWQAPAGEWTVVRFGHVNMLRTNRPAEAEATGWETSKLDKEAIENHLRNGMMGHLQRQGGPLDGHKIHGMLIDSWESYVPTWTMKKERLSQEFKQRRGYNMMPFLPATMGYIVDSVDTSNKFLRDLRQTMDDLYVENFFAHFRTVAHDMGSKVYTEGAVGETLPGDPLRYYGVSDYPMTEFWYPKAPSNQKEAKPIYAAASAYHLYDKPLLAAEAGTQLFVKWNESPKDINYLINENFAKGVNHLVFHTFSHTPQTDVVPGSSFGGTIGFPLLRTQTWWRHTPVWMGSLARAQYLLQQGEFVADVLWYLGDELDRHPFDTAPFPKGYKFDYLNEELLHSKVKVTDGQLHVEGAGNYKVIMLRDSQNMLLSTAKKLKQLVQQGAVILGNKPQTSPSLMDDAHDLMQLKQISDELWGKQQAGVNTFGKGKVYWGHTLEQVLAAEAIQPDVSVADATDVRWIHRETDDADIYYVTNQHDTAIDVSVQFRAASKQIELWHIATGKTESALLSKKVAKKATKQVTEQLTNVLLQLAPHGSQFVVFAKQPEQTTKTFEQLLVDGEVALQAEPLWYQIHHGEKAPVEIINGQVITNVNANNNASNQKQSASEIRLTSTTDESIKLTHKQQIFELNQPWQLVFEAGWDTPEFIMLDKLQTLNSHANEAIRHYSGSVSYQTRFEFKQDNKHQFVQLDLGQVYDIAEVWLNGQRVATRLAPPYTFDISPWLKQGSNQLTVVVTNTWRNQLIYDIKRPNGEKKTWTTNPPKSHETKLEASGLIGPVSLIKLTID